MAERPPRPGTTGYHRDRDSGLWLPGEGDGYYHHEEPPKSNAWKFLGIGIDRWIELLLTAVLAIANIFLWIANYKLAAQAERQSGISTQLLDAAAKSADAAGNANDLASQSVAQNLEASQFDQRAWIYVSRIQLLKEPDESESVIKTSVIINNSGKTPGIDFTNTTAVALTPLAAGESKRPDWSKAAVSSPAVIFPSTSSVSSSYPADLKETDKTRDELRLAIRTYRAKQSRLFVRTYLRYRDVFGFPHFTEACLYHVFGDPLDSFSYCSTGNDLDSEPQRLIRTPQKSLGPL
jgi:hypothetical protein